jgi:hypothetical protein
MVIFKGTGVVWDKEKHRPLCRFINGEYKVEDPRTQSILTNLGYKSGEVELKEVEIIEPIEEVEDGVEIIESNEVFDMTIRELKEYCKEYGYKGYSNLGKDELLKFIEDKEGAL